MSLELPEYALKRVEALEDRVRGHPGLRAMETSLTILALGGTVWLGFKGYDMASDMLLGVDEAMRGVEGYLTPIEVEVNAACLTDDALNIMRAKWSKEKGAGGIRAVTVNTNRFRGIQAKVTDGVGKLGTPDIRFMKGVEQHLVKVGYIVAEETTGRLHPLDRATGFILESKTFPMLILGLALLPVLPVLGGVLRGAVKNE